MNYIRTKTNKVIKNTKKYCNEIKEVSVNPNKSEFDVILVSKTGNLLYKGLYENMPKKFIGRRSYYSRRFKDYDYYVVYSK